MGLSPSFKRLFIIGLFFGFCLSLKSLVAETPAVNSLATGRRPPWTTSRIKGSPEPPLPYTYELAFPKLQFNGPVTITNAPGTSRLFVAEVSGKIYSFPNNPDVDSVDLMIDVSKCIQGNLHIYGFTFHPNFEENGYVYVSIVGKELDEEELSSGSRISRFTVTRMDPPRANPDSELVIFTWRAGGHNGCSLKFGPDGYLYFSTGDGSGPNPPDPHRTGQDLTNVCSSILRIDVNYQDDGKNYRIPADNPFVDLDDARPEIWAYGLRNPWKMSFDQETGDLWVGDVGWEAWEMIYRVQRGGNYGWSIMEGRQPIHPGGKRGPTPILPPVKDHDHFEARSITGGFVYRGSRLSNLFGVYIYGDFSTGRMWGFRYDGERITWFQELVDTPLKIVGFGEDNAGELYFLDFQEMEGGYGKAGIYRLVPNTTTDHSGKFPRMLSDTGLFSSVENHIPASGIVPYTVATELWADHAYAERFLAIPGGEQIDADGTFPNDTVLMRTVYLNLTRGDPASRRRMETQIIHRNDNNWRLYTYMWNDAQTDATLADSTGLEQTISISDPNSATGTFEQVWRVASRAECSICHSDKMGAPLGVNPIQLHHDYDYGHGPENQIAAWTRMGIFSKPYSEESLKKRMVNPHDTTASLEDRARSYLHVNCQHCHRPGGGGSSMIRLDYRLTNDETGTIDIQPSHGTFGLADGHIISPGDPFASVLFYRMAKLGRGHMPHIASHITDRRGLQLIYDWIAQLPPSRRESPAGNNSIEDENEQSHIEFPNQLAATLQTLRTIETQPTLSATKTLHDLLASTRGAMLLSQVLKTETVSKRVRDEAIAMGVRHLDINIRDLFEQFVPPEERTQRLGEHIDPQTILSLEGDVEHGRRAFQYGSTSICRNCHRVYESGEMIGPPLTEIGKKYKSREILETILNPSKQIEDKYRVYVAANTNGTVVSGLLIEKTPEWISIKNNEGRIFRSPVADIEELTPQTKSLMPDLLLRDITVQEAADLLAFLSALK